MFGNANQSGFKALALYDTNRDGRIDAFDDVFKNLKLWQDRNGDGRVRGKVWWAKRRRKIVRRDNGKVVEFEEV